MSSRSKKSRAHRHASPAAAFIPAGQPEAFGIGGNYQAAQWSTDRGRVRWNGIDTREELSNYERSEILRRIHWLKGHFGFVLGLVNNSADLVGWHTPQAQSGDADWDDLAEEAFRFRCAKAVAFDVGAKFNFATAQPMLMRAAFTDAHIFTVLTKWDDGAARFAFYEAAALRNPKDCGKDWRDGIRISRAGRHLAYGFLDSDTGKVVEIPASSVIYFGEFDSPRQDAPVPKLAHAVLNSIDIMEIWGFQKKAVKISSLSGVLIERAAGSSPSRALQGMVGAPVPIATGTGRFQREDVWDGGQINKLEPGESAKILADNRPSPEQRQLVLDLKRDIAYGWGLPLEVVDAISELTGPGIRFVLDVAGNWIECRRERQKEWLEKVWLYTISCEIAAGRLAPPPDKDGKKGKWWGVSFTGRRLLTIDRGKESAARIKEIEAGVGTWQGWEPIDGRDWQDRIRQRVKEWKFFEDECARAGVDPADVIPPRQGAAAPATAADDPAPAAEPPAKSKPKA
jgi:capsid protein